tara:strand:+ start:723 stop:923 length:201 start_codon:yes stop_codon:yes gene_type:complete
MNTLDKLKHIGAKEIKLESFSENLIGRISFNVNGVEFSGQFDIDNTGLYAVELVSELSELNKLNIN